MTERCDECLFWKLTPGKETHADDQEGYCRRRAPQPSSYQISKLADLFGRLVWCVEELAKVKHEDDDGYNFHMQSDEWAEWPITFSNEWCGEFERKRRRK